MSTGFHRMNPPVTSVRLDEGPGHDRVSVWTDHGLSGTLTVTAGQGRRLCLVLTRADQAVTRVGVGDGMVGLIVADDPPEPDECLVSDYGDVTTLSELRAAPNVERVIRRT